MPPNDVLQMDVRWLTFPFSDGSEGKWRPVLVLSNDAYNNGPDLLVCAVTSNLAARPYSAILEPRHFQEGKLPVASRVRTDKLFSADKSLFGPKLGRVSPSFFGLVVKQIRQLIEEK